MRSRWYRYFWTELGRRMIEPERVSELPGYLPVEMKNVLQSQPPPLGSPVFRQGSRLSSRKARHIYGYTWEVLRAQGFNRPLRLRPWPGISLLFPYSRNNIVIIPQAFSERIPPEKRALSLVGRTGAAQREGYELWVIPALWNDDITAIFRIGGIKACSLDKLVELCENGFS